MGLVAVCVCLYNARITNLAKTTSYKTLTYKEIEKMAKEAYYFSHDSNARNDDKIIAMRMRHGMEGYGIYWTIIERLRECDNYTSVKDYNVISYEIRVSADKVKSIVEDYGLFTFTDDGKRFYSESLNRRMDIKEEKSEKAREKAKKKMGKTE